VKRRRAANPLSLAKTVARLRSLVDRLPYAQRIELIGAWYDERRLRGRSIDELLERLQWALEEAGKVRPLPGPGGFDGRKQIAYSVAKAWLTEHKMAPSARSKDFQAELRKAIEANGMKVPRDLRPLATFGIRIAQAGSKVKIHRA
jgi:hypothetical protein